MMLVDVDLLTPAQIQTYLNDGVLVVPLLSAVELQEAQCGLVDTLKQEYGVDVGDLEGTGRGLMAASSTNGAGELENRYGLLIHCSVYNLYLGKDY
jgi:hypothetical protein